MVLTYHSRLFSTHCALSSAPPDNPPARKDSPSIVHDTCKLCWWFTKYALLVALAAAVGAGAYYYNHANEEIRLRVQAKLAEHYRDLRVDVRSAHLVEGEGIEIRGLTISDPQVAGVESELAYFDEIVLSCNTELKEFLQGEPQINHMHIRRPRLRAVRTEDGWSIARLFPCPKFAKRRVETTIENGVVEVIDTSKIRPTTFTLRELHVQLEPLLDGTDDEPIKYRGTIAGDYFQRAEFSGQIEPQSGNCSVEGTLVGLDLTPEFREALPVELGDRLAPLHGLRAACSLDFCVKHSRAAEEPLEFKIDGRLSQGRFDDPRLPQALTDLAARFHVDNGGIHVDQLTAKSGHSSLNLFGELRGFAPGAPMFVQVEADHLLVGRDWESRLTGELRELWRKFLPAGELHAQLRLSFDGDRWQPEIKLTCINVSYTFYKFPYRVDRATGVVTLRDNHLSMDLKAFAGGRPIKIDAEVDDPGPRFTGAVVVRGENMPVEPNLLAALKPKPQEILRSLNPVGTFDFLMRVLRDRADQPYVNQQLALELNRCSVLFDKFPYPLNNVTGTVQMKDGHWWFDNLQGTNDTGTIFCHGTLKPALDGAELMLHFSGENVPLEEELRDALPPPHRKIWNDFKPRGVVKLRDATVRYLSAKKKPEISFSIEPVPGTTSIEPVHFPYRIENLQGILSYKEVRAEQEGRVDFDRVRGVHERTPIGASGFCQFTSEGAWRLKFDRLTADRLHVDRDRDLFVALPDKLKKVVADLRPTGPIQMDGELELSRVSPTSPLQANWKNLTFDLRQASIETGVTLENIDGRVTLTGSHDGAHLKCFGELDVDSLTYRDFQFTEVRGPLWIDDTQFILGEHARRAEPGRPPRRATAKLYGGTAVADVGVTFGGPKQYTVQATLTDADLARFARATPRKTKAQRKGRRRDHAFGRGARAPWNLGPRSGPPS